MLTPRQDLEIQRKVLTSVHCDHCSPALHTCGEGCSIWKRFNDIQLRMARIDRAEREQV